jgi:MarR family transcriptional regulator, organic hydroperoxide resistance regulator
MADFPPSSIYLLKRAELAVRGCVEMALREVTLTPSQYFILFLVKTGEATSSAELARSMGVLPQSMTELIAPLEKRGAIARRRDDRNQRILRIELTSAGQRLFERATGLAIRLEQELLEDLDAPQIEQLNKGFAALIASAEKHSFHPKLRRLEKTAAKAKAAPAAPKARARRSRAAARG